MSILGSILVKERIPESMAYLSHFHVLLERVYIYIMCVDFFYIDFYILCVCIFNISHEETGIGDV